MTDNKGRFAEKLARLGHEEWARNRKQPSKELAVRALRLLDETARSPVDADDALPTTDRVAVTKEARFSGKSISPENKIHTAQSRRK